MRICSLTDELGKVKTEFAALVEECRIAAVNGTAKTRVAPPCTEDNYKRGRFGIEKVPYLTGESAEELEDWLFKVELFFNLYNIAVDNHRERINSVGLFMKNPASTINPDGQWEDLVAELNGIFQNFKYKRDQRCKLKHLKKGEQGFQAYLREYTRLSGLVGEMSMEDKIVYFMDGLRENTRKKVEYENPTTINLAINIATRYEQSLRAPKNENSAQVAMARRIRPRTSLDNDTRWCRVCKSSSHNTVDCRRRKNNRPDSNIDTTTQRSQ